MNLIMFLISDIIPRESLITKVDILQLLKRWQLYGMLWLAPSYVNLFNADLPKHIHYFSFPEVPSSSSGGLFDPVPKFYPLRKIFKMVSRESNTGLLIISSMSKS